MIDMTDTGSGSISDVVVVKVGGALLGTPLDAFWQGIGELRLDKRVIVVHGGGPEATRVARLV